MARFLVLLVLSLLIPSTARSGDSFFPIGIWEAQMVPDTCAGADCTTLDEIRGSQALGYQSGINAVFCYFHADLGFLQTSPQRVECYLEEAQALGFKALIKLADLKTFTGPPFSGDFCYNLNCPGKEGLYYAQNCSTLNNFPTLYERTPPDTTDHAAVIRHLAALEDSVHDALLGYYFADEPLKIYGSSAGALRAARETYETIDDVPYFLGMYDYSPYGFGDSTGWTDYATFDERRCDWFWDGELVQSPYTFPECGPTTTPDYRNVADVITYQTYRNDSTLWRHELGQFDDLVSGGQEVHAILPDFFGGPSNPGEELTLTAAQRRLQAYGYIIHGARGIWFFSYTRMYDPARIHPSLWSGGTRWAPCGDTLYTVPPVKFVEEIVPLSNELASILPFLEGSTARSYWRDATPCGGDFHSVGSETLMTATAGDIHYLMKYAEDQNLLIVMNASADSAEVTFDFSNLSPTDPLVAPARAAVWALRIEEPDTLEISYDDGTFSDLFIPWSVHVYRLKAPPEIPVPQDRPEIQDGINLAVAGQTVRVSWREVPYSGIEMKRGVRVEMASGPDVPEIVAADSVSIAVDYPTDADARTALVGFVITGGSGTDSVVRLRGDGQVVDCDIRAGTGQPDQGIWVPGGAGEILNTRVLMDATGYSANGIEVQDASPVIDGCEVRARNGYSTSTGILVNSGAPVIQNTYVSAMDHGIWVSGSTSVVSCTVDSTYKAGIIASGDAVVENTIVSNVIQGSTNDGIAGTTVRYCIAPDGISATTEEGNSLDDPLYCNPAAHTLRVDSYGNPNNNDSEKLIGKFPVACMGDTLVRNSTYSGGTLDMRGHVTIPADRALTLGAGTTVTVDTTSVPGSGKPEIRVLGALQVDGSYSGRSSIRSAQGHRARGGASGHTVRVPTSFSTMPTYTTSRRGSRTTRARSIPSMSRIASSATSPTRSSFWMAMGSGGLVRLLNTSIHMEGAPLGVWIDSGAETYGVDFDSVTVTGDADGEYGIVLNTGAAGTPPIFEVDRLGSAVSRRGPGSWAMICCPAIHGGKIAGCNTGDMALRHRFRPIWE